MVLKKFGGIENFVLEDVSKPQVKAGEVSVRVIAIGLDPIDVKTRRGGGVASGYEGDAPMVLGWSISGIVDRVGPGVENFSAGDAVFGTVNFPGRGGAYAEYVVAPAGQLARKPVRNFFYGCSRGYIGGFDSLAGVGRQGACEARR